MPPITVLSHGAQNPMTAAKVEYIDFLPDYPASDPNGYAYIINTVNSTSLTASAKQTADGTKSNSKKEGNWNYHG